MTIKGSIRKIKKRFVAGFGLTLLSERLLLTGLIVLTSKFPDDESASTAQHTQAKLP
jgi:hypothetical protein